MEKSELKNGMVVATRSNRVFMVIGNFLISESDSIPLGYYSENLSHYKDDDLCVDEVFDIPRDFGKRPPFDILRDYREFVGMVSKGTRDYVKEHYVEEILVEEIELEEVFESVDVLFDDSSVSYI